MLIEGLQRRLVVLQTRQLLCEDCVRALQQCHLRPNNTPLLRQLGVLRRQRCQTGLHRHQVEVRGTHGHAGSAQQRGATVDALQGRQIALDEAGVVSVRVGTVDVQVEDAVSVVCAVGCDVGGGLRKDKAVCFTVDTDVRIAGGAGIARWLERRTRDRKVSSSSPGRSGERIFFSRINFVC